MRSPLPYRWLVASRIGLLTFACTATLFAQTSLEAIFSEARTHEKQGDYAAAERDYRQALSAAPDSLEALKRLGVLQQTELKFADSIDSFLHVLRRDPHYSEINFFLGVSYYGQGDLAKATASLKEELNTPKPHPRTHFYLAKFLQASGQTSAAILQLEESLTAKPDDPDALYELARLHKDASYEAMERLKRLDPDSYHVHLLLGELYSDEDHFPEAIKQFEAASRKRPNAQGLHYLIGLANWSQHLYDVAQKDFLLALQENPTDGLTNLYLGDISVRNGNFAEALPYLENAQRVLPGLSQVHLLLGKCYQGQQQFEKAKNELLAAIEIDPSAAQAHYLLAQVYRKLNDLTASTSELAKYEELSKSQPETTQLRKIGSDE